MFRQDKPMIAALVITVAISSILHANDKFSAARANYDSQLSGLESKYSGASEWPAEYKKSLTALGAALQGSGDLDGLIAVRAELKRFAGDNTIPAEAVVEAPLGLKELQEKYQKSKDHQSLDKSKAVVALADKYVAYLERQMKELTIAGDVDNALVARAEVKRVKTSAIVSAAQFDVGVIQSEKQAEKEPPAVGEEAPEEGPDVQAKKKPTAPAGYVLYEPGRRPPRVASQKFTRMSLKPTSNTPMTKRWATASASCCIASSGTQKNSAIRVQVRSAKSSVVLKDQTVNIQFFTRPAKVKGKVMPTRIRSDYIKLPELTSGGIYIDCPDVKTSISRSSSRYSRLRRKSGSEFYAILINVYNADGTSSYQGASASELDDFAFKSVELSKEQVAKEKIASAKAVYDQARTAYYGNTSDAALRAEFNKARTDYNEARGVQPRGSSSR